METSMSATNMVLFDSEGRLKKYATANEILKEFYELRVEFYQKRQVSGSSNTNHNIHYQYFLFFIYQYFLKLLVDTPVVCIPHPQYCYRWAFVVWCDDT